MWSKFGWFTSLVCIGSVAGALAWGASLQNYIYYYDSFDPDSTRLQFYNAYALSYRYFSVFYIMYAVEFLCLVISKLMMLDRLVNDASRNWQDQQLEDPHRTDRCFTQQFGVRWLPRIHRIVASIVVLCSLASLTAYTAAGVYGFVVADVSFQAAASCDLQGGDTNSSRLLFARALELSKTSYDAQAIQNVCETLALIFISLWYATIIAFCVARFRRAEHLAAQALVSVAAHTQSCYDRDNRTKRAISIVDHTMHAAADQRRRLMAACLVVLITFPARAAFDVMNAFAAFDLQVAFLMCALRFPCDVCCVFHSYSSNNLQLNPACPPCDPCQSQQWLINTWIQYTPEFQPIVVSLSSPLPLMASIWLLTAAHARAIAITAKVQRAGLGGALSTPTPAKIDGGN